MGKIEHLMYMPMTGLGLYGGHRGNRWLKNRIKIFKQFVLPSLKAQTSKNFILWVSFRYEDKGDPIIKEFRKFFDTVTEFRTVFTYSGICFWDDKYEDKIAHERLVLALHGAMGELLNTMKDPDEILMSIQPSDDCYNSNMVEEVQKFFSENEDVQAVGYKKGYVMDYLSKNLAEWNPVTNPPFYTIRFPKEIFVDPFSHMKYTGPYKSHEYVGDNLKMMPLEGRGFLVGTHGENISTIFKHPFTGQHFEGETKEAILDNFGLEDVPQLEIRTSLRKIIMRKLPHGWQRKLRYWLGQRFYARFYDFIRN